MSELWVAGSAATGDYHPGVSDLDLVALVDGSLDGGRRAALNALHRELDAGSANGAVLGCAYVERSRRADPAALHPTWAHGAIIADLGLTSMARGRHALRTGELLTKTASIDTAHAPQWLRDDLRARRDGLPARSPRLRTAWIAWIDARRTTRAAR